jgi:phosphoserine phosphatase
VRTHFAFDLDGTITEHELLPIIASKLGLQTEMHLLTRLTLNGTIGFEESFRLRCAILKAVPVDEVQQIVAEVSLNDEIGAFIRQNRDCCSVITGNLDIWVRPLIERLGCRFFTSTARADGNRMLGLDRVLHKSNPIHEIRFAAGRIVAIGEGANDIPMFEAADIGVAYGGVHCPASGLIEISDYVVFDGSALCRLLRTL